MGRRRQRAPLNPIAEAINETASHVAGVNTSVDIDRRRAWLFVAEPTLREWAAQEGIEGTSPMEVLAAQHFKKPPTTVVRVGQNFRGVTLYAVWNGKEEEPYFEPEF